jgi:Asp-tRNA(Asn)/Glu-tRNA(Gln) amidotransferase A subunit family amidase
MEETDIKGLRVGYFPDFFTDAHPGVVEVCQTTLQYLVQKGAQLVDISIPDLGLLRVAHSLTIVSEIFSLIKSRQQNDVNQLSYPNLFLCLGQENVSTTVLCSLELNSLFTLARAPHRTNQNKGDRNKY